MDPPGEPVVAFELRTASVFPPEPHPATDEPTRKTSATAVSFSLPIASHEALTNGAISK